MANANPNQLTISPTPNPVEPEEKVETAEEAEHERVREPEIVLARNEALVRRDGKRVLVRELTNGRRYESVID